MSQSTTNMSLEQARKVLWFRNNPRPMGELLDEGYLDRKRLLWATEKAFVPIVAQAAHVLLENLKHKPTDISPQSAQLALPVEIPVEMSIETARNTLWVFAPYQNMPMGQLVDSKQLSLKDLGYAIENARNQRVRQAAKTLILARLEQSIQEPEPDAGYLKVVSWGRSFAQQEESLYTAFMGMFAGAVISLPVYYMLAATFNRPSPTTPRPSLPEVLSNPLNIIGLIILLSTIGFLIWAFLRLIEWVMDKFFMEKILQFRKGQEAEERVVTIISQVLDGNWHLFRNIELPSKNSDVDGILVSAAGIWVLEVKAFTGEYRNIGEHWEYHNGKRWKLASKNPSKQAQRNALALSQFLKADGIQQWVNPVVIWANPDNLPTIDNPMVPVWTLDRLQDELGNIWHSNKISDVQQAQIIDKLNRLGKKNRAKYNNQPVEEL